MPPPQPDAELLDETVRFVKEVKEFGKTLGIEPTPALARSSNERQPHSMLWLWLQKRGTLAVRTPIDIRLWLRFSAARQELPLDRLFNISDYSLYYRQGNQFADPRSVTTVDFAKDFRAVQAKVTLHEDLHDAKNFDLPWEIEESLITPLGMLAALRFFEHRDDEANAREIRLRIADERLLSRELSEIAREAERLFGSLPLPEARGKLRGLLASYPTYARWFQFQTGGQDPDMVLEAKISHDLAYYRFYERIILLGERKENVKRLITDLKKLPPDVSGSGVDEYLSELEIKYGAVAP